MQREYRHGPHSGRGNWIWMTALVVVLIAALVVWDRVREAQRGEDAQLIADRGDTSRKPLTEADPWSGAEAAPFEQEGYRLMDLLGNPRTSGTAGALEPLPASSEPSAAEAGD